MADRRSLRLIGLIYGGLTGLVMMAAVFVVAGHLRGDLHLEAAPTVIAASVR